MLNAYEKFDKFKRSNMSMKDYLNEFERLNQEVIAYQVLKNAGLPKITCDSELTFDNMKKQQKAISDQCTKAAVEEENILVEDELYYTAGRQNFNIHKGQWNV